MKLSVKLFFLFWLFAMVPVMSLGYLSYDYSRDSIIRKMTDHLVATNILKKAELDRWLLNNASVLEMLAGLINQKGGIADTIPVHDMENPAHAAFHKEIAEKFLKPVMEKSGFFELFILRKEDGLILLSTDPQQEGKYRENRSFFKKGKIKTFVENMYYSITLQAPAMTIATPIRDEQGNLVAVVAGRLDLIDLSEIIGRRSTISTTEDTYLVNKFNFFVTEPRFGKNFMLKKSVYTQGVKKALLHSNGNGLYEDYQGLPVIGAYHWIPEWELCMITEIGQDEAFAPIFRLRRNMLMLCTGTLLISFFAGLTLARMFTRPIKRLIEETGKISLGHRDFRADTSARDEIGDLARAFEGMVQRLETTLVSRDELQDEVIERKAVEKKLKGVLVDLERSNRDLQQFAYTASHDLQEPLRMVSSYCQLLSQRYQNQLDEKAHKFIHYAVDGAIRMQNLINDLLSYSRVTTKGSDLQAVDSHAALGLALANLHNAIQESGVLVTSSELPSVWADPTQLTQVFQNLIGNSIKYKGSNGPPRIHVSVQKVDQDWRFGVTDNGIGIDLQYKDKIFIIFQRLHTRDEYPGTGIGLALCKRIVERHGGAIWFESELGKGSTFYFTMKNTEGRDSHDRTSIDETH